MPAKTDAKPLEVFIEEFTEKLQRRKDRWRDEKLQKAKLDLIENVRHRPGKQGSNFTFEARGQLIKQLRECGDIDAVANVLLASVSVAPQPQPGRFPAVSNMSELSSTSAGENSSVNVDRAAQEARLAAEVAARAEMDRLAARAIVKAEAKAEEHRLLVAAEVEEDNATREELREMDSLELSTTVRDCMRCRPGHDNVVRAIQSHADALKLVRQDGASNALWSGYENLSGLALAAQVPRLAHCIALKRAKITRFEKDHTEIASELASWVRRRLCERLCDVPSTQQLSEQSSSKLLDVVSREVQDRIKHCLRAAQRDMVKWKWYLLSETKIPFNCDIVTHEDVFIIGEGSIQASGLRDRDPQETQREQVSIHRKDKTVIMFEKYKEIRKQREGLIVEDYPCEEPKEVDHESPMTFKLDISFKILTVDSDLVAAYRDDRVSANRGEKESLKEKLDFLKVRKGSRKFEVLTKLECDPPLALMSLT